MTIGISDTREAIFDALDGIEGAQVYRHRAKTYQYPSCIVGWPQTVDVRAAAGGLRDYVIDVWLGVEITDDEGASEQLEALLEAAVERLLDGSSSWDVQPADEFGEGVTNDGRAIVGCRIPVAVFA